MIDEIKKYSKTRMNKCIETFKLNINKIRTSCAHPHILDNISVEYYGAITPLSQVANVIAEDSHTLAITVFDRSLSSSIEKAITVSNLGLNPIIMDKIIRIPFPALTEERRKEMIKIVRSEAEQSKISIRNVRRDTNDKIRLLLKDKKISVDEDRKSQDEVQKITNTMIKNIDILLINKEKELMKI
ncbi:ribosome recycling factor [Candidatus Profftia sp. (ex Adelges kitamiensis)]|uniref:ribosome recycling factor n=1 Tax=Candidatus Profftia sp. (ex Adelges kitamiensis) TaxID=2864218 RepID=UPI001CE23EB7|nr:ribosome recycling factor [Candidatus Profftia sp. (ex Adelges kitamiensis)]